MIGIWSLSASSALLPEMKMIKTMSTAVRSWVAIAGIAPHAAGQNARIDSARPKL